MMKQEAVAFNVRREFEEARGWTILCFSHLRWDFVYQRPQHLLSRAARSNRVYFFEEPVFEYGTAPQLRIRETDSNMIVVVPVLPAGTPASRMDHLLSTLLDELVSTIGTGRMLHWYYTPLALAFSQHLHADLCVYDNMDELSAFRGASPSILTLEGELLRRADVVFTGGQSLYEAKRDRHRNMHLLPSSIDVVHFRGARRRRARGIPEYSGMTRPRLGFFGVIDERMDLGLLARMARLRPRWNFIMIGPIVKIDPSTLPVDSNIFWLGQKSYRELPDHLSGWDLGIMPFAINEATRFISPTKTPEFLAAGLPVISSPIADVSRPYGELGLVEIASSPESFVAKAEELLSRPRQPWLERVDEFLSTRSWDKTWQAMQAAIDCAAAMKPIKFRSSRERANV